MKMFSHPAELFCSASRTAVKHISFHWQFLEWISHFKWQQWLLGRLSFYHFYLYVWNVCEVDCSNPGGTVDREAGPQTTVSLPTYRKMEED